MAKKTYNPKTLWIVSRVLEAILLIVTGVLAIIYNNNSTLQKVVFILIGVFFLLDGIIRVLRYYIHPLKAYVIGKGLVASTFELAFGLLLCIKPDLLPGLVNDLLVLFLAVYCFALAAIFIVQGGVSIKLHSRKIVVIVFEFIAAACLITCGVLLLVYQNSTNLVAVAIIIMGVVMVVGGILLLIDGFRPFDKSAEKIVDARVL